MKSFFSDLRRIDRQAFTKRQPKHNAIDRALKSLATSILIAGAFVGGIEGFSTRSASAAPTRKDWCGTVWSVENTSILAWINPATGVTTSTGGPTSQITMPGGSMGTSVAAIGIHKESGTMFAFDRNGTTGTLYKYKFGVDTTWQAVSVSGLIGLSGTQTIPNAINNLNKMSVDGNNLYIADSTAIALYTIPLNSAGTVIGNATSEIYSFSGDPVGTPAHSGTGMNGGDITTDEYGDTYNITYTSTTAYFYKQDALARTWIYQGETPATAAFAGAAFYKGDLYVKAGTQLKKVDLTKSGSGYTGWNNPLVNVGSPSSTSSADLTACGTPNITITKTQQIYTDAAASTLAANQTKVQTGQYIKYIITAKNTGDAFAKSANLADNLPIGTSYIPNSATLNGTNLGIATYPTAGFAINSPGQATGIIPFAPDPDTATLTFVVQVTAIAGSVQNRATISYVDNSGLTSEVSNCTAGSIVNCGDSPNLPIASKAKLMLVKRITAINGVTTGLTTFVDDTTSSKQTDDNHCNWPGATGTTGACTNTYTVGATTQTAPKVKPGDEIEYSIYYLNSGNNAANPVRICDMLDPNLTFQQNFNASNVGKGIGFNPGGTGITYLTNLGTDTDKGQLTGTSVTNCNLPSNGGTEVVVVDVGDTTTPLAGSTGAGAPTGSYGYIRFKAVVK
jgi:uncharacterized repeat protein (TIGR01451 family)